MLRIHTYVMEKTRHVITMRKNSLPRVSGTIKQVLDYKHRDVPLWHSFDTEKYEINLFTDKKNQYRGILYPKRMQFIEPLFFAQPEKESIQKRCNGVRGV